MMNDWYGIDDPCDPLQVDPSFPPSASLLQFCFLLLLPSTTCVLRLRCSRHLRCSRQLLVR